MKIAINGETIDTKNIYKITDIQHGYDHANLGFAVEMFNRKQIYINIKTECHGYDYSKVIMIGGVSMSGTTQDIHTSDIYGDKLKRITTMRDNIVRVWSDNQPDIPQFNI